MSKKKLLTGAACLVLLTTLSQGPVAHAAGESAPLELLEIGADATSRCKLVGDIAGSDAMFVGLMAKKGSRRAKERATKQGIDLGADSVVWGQRGTSMTNEWTGKAYACGQTPQSAKSARAANPAAASVPATAAAPAANAGTSTAINEVPMDAAASCRLLGDVAGSDAMFVGLMAKKGSRRAKEKAMKQAADLGANTVAWSQQGTSMTNEWIGKAYACGNSAAPSSARKAQEKASSGLVQASDAAAPGSLRELLSTQVGKCRVVGDIAGSDAMFVGLMAKKGSRRAKEKAVKQANDLGANAVVWSQQGTSMTNEWVGKAYRCP